MISWTSCNEWGEIAHNAVLKCSARELDLVKEYATHDYDAVLNQYYAKARFYDADNRRFTAVDPVLDPASYDLSVYAAEPVRLVQYLYVKDNAVNLIDPLGLWTFAIGADLAGAMGLRVSAGSQLVLDGYGNTGILGYTGAGAGTTTASFVGTVTFTNANSITELKGLGNSAGISGPSIGVESTIAEGVLGVTLSSGIAIAAIPSEGHGEITYTGVKVITWEPLANFVKGILNDVMPQYMELLTCEQRQQLGIY